MTSTSYRERLGRPSTLVYLLVVAMGFVGPALFVDGISLTLVLVVAVPLVVAATLLSPFLMPAGDPPLRRAIWPVVMVGAVVVAGIVYRAA